VWKGFQSQIQKLSLLSRTAKPIQTPGNGLMKGCLLEIAKRNAGGGARKMQIRPTRFQWTQYKDDLHFYIALGVIPIGSIIFYANFFIGNSELAEIPEDYEPKVWEYYKNPIHRWMMKYMYDDPVKFYEMAACKHVLEFEKVRYNVRRSMVTDMMRQQDDYRGYYFEPAVNPIPKEALDAAEPERRDNTGSNLYNQY